MQSTDPECIEMERVISQYQSFESATEEAREAARDKIVNTCANSAVESLVDVYYKISNILCSTQMDATRGSSLEVLKVEIVNTCANIPEVYLLSYTNVCDALCTIQTYIQGAQSSYESSCA